ncbi:MAG TPA: IS110 family transposase [Casimicrobiaceae bacterium]|nr:IS110 family transposase [Casimicrobiaceae bacterium]
MGLDVHKDSIEIAVARPDEEVRSLGRVGYDEAGLVARLRRIAPAEQLRCWYEAGPTGFGLQRALARRGIACQVVAPSLIPRAWGERIKTDRRDAVKLARLGRSGDLATIHIPEPAHEYARDLIRTRARAVQDLHRQRQRMLKLLLRWEMRPPSTLRSTWTHAYQRWLDGLRFADGAQQQVFEHLQMAIAEAEHRRERLDAATRVLATRAPWHQLITALSALHGVAELSAAILVGELAPFSRFADAHKCMAAACLVPREHSSGASIRRGPITRTGSPWARYALVEAAHHYRLCRRTHESKRVRAIRAGLPAVLASHARDAQARLARLAQRLYAHGKAPQLIVVAVARELAGAVWKMGVLIERAD